MRSYFDALELGLPNKSIFIVHSHHVGLLTRPAYNGSTTVLVLASRSPIALWQMAAFTPTQLQTTINMDSRENSTWCVITSDYGGS